MMKKTLTICLGLALILTLCGTFAGAFGGEVDNSVFDRYIEPLYKEASFKPYIIAAMIFLAKVKDPQATLKALEERGLARWFQK